jgi:hypothetical protein
MQPPIGYLDERGKGSARLTVARSGSKALDRRLITASLRRRAPLDQYRDGHDHSVWTNGAENRAEASEARGSQAMSLNTGHAVTRAR